MRETKRDRRQDQKRQRQSMAQARARRARRRWIIRGGAVFAAIVVIAVVAAIVISRRDNQPVSTIAGVESFGNLDRSHVQTPVSYPQTPPVGGPHSPVWQNCGYYSSPVKNENAVHSLEHGAIWITYRPDLPADQVAALRKLAGQTYVLVTPYPDLPAPVVASAWGKQLKLEAAGDPRLNQFLRTYREGPQTPEKGSACTGGTGLPQ